MTAISQVGSVRPIARNFVPICIVSIGLAGIMAVVSIACLAHKDVVYATEEMRRGLAPNNVVDLCLAVPLLILCSVLALRGRLTGLLCLPGALLYVLYNYAVYACAMPFGPAFLADLTCVAVSLYAAVALLASIDGRVIAGLLPGRVPCRTAGGVLAALGALTLVHAMVALIGGIAGDNSVTRPALAVDIVDFLVSPVWIAGGVLLWRRSALGFAGATGLLAQASMLFLGLIGFLIAQPLMNGVPVSAGGVLIVGVMGLTCFVPFVLFLRGVIAADKPHGFAGSGATGCDGGSAE